VAGVQDPFNDFLMSRHEVQQFAEKSVGNPDGGYDVIKKWGSSLFYHGLLRVRTGKISDLSIKCNSIDTMG
jgi:hypothetical protein